MNERKLRAVIEFLVSLERARGCKLSTPQVMTMLYLFEGISYLRNGKPAIGLKFVKTKAGVFSREAKKVLEEVRRCWNGNHLGRRLEDVETHSK